MTLTIAVLGTGILGRAIAERLQAAGCTVVVFNRTASKALHLQSQGIAVVGSAEMAVRQADCTLLLLADTAAVRSTVLTPPCSAAMNGKTLMQMGTIGPNESLRLQEAIERSGGTYCQAPVLGS
jgi:3-hydroxyisobutyrate dehydrogenase